MFLFCHRYSAASSVARSNGVMLFVGAAKSSILDSSSLLVWLVVIVAISLRELTSYITYVWRAFPPQNPCALHRS